MAWLATFLGAGPRWSVEIHLAQDHAGITENKLNSAKKRLHVESRQANSRLKGRDVSSYTNEDHRKFVYALIARDIRRLTAKVHRANVDDDTRQMIDAALDQLETRAWLLAFHDRASGDLIPDQDFYSDGRPVTTTISWGDGYATLVHSPDPNDETGGAAEELSEEVWPTGAETTVGDEDLFDTLKIDREDDVE